MNIPNYDQYAYLMKLDITDLIQLYNSLPQGTLKTTVASKISVKQHQLALRGK